MVAVRFNERGGLAALGSLTAELYPLDSDGLVSGPIANGAGGDTPVEIEDFLYEFTVSQLLTDWHKVLIKLDGDPIPIAATYVLMSLNAIVHNCGNYMGVTPSIAVTVVGTTVTLIRGDTLSIPLTVGNITGRTKLWFGLKEKTQDLDSQAQLLVEESAGLLYVNRAAPVAGQTSTITVINAVTGSLLVGVSAPASAQLNLVNRGVWAVQMLSPVGVTQMTHGVGILTQDVIRAVA